MLANHYHVAKSTIVRRATKYDWQAKRDLYQQKRIKNLQKISGEKEHEIDERHLGRLRLIQTVLGNDFMQLAIKQQETNNLTNQEMRRMWGNVNPMKNAIMAERNILGVRTKPVIFNNPDDIYDYQITMGLVPEPPNQTYKDTKAAIETLDKLIARRKRMQSYIDEIDRRGAY
jgi:hypothetical protein